MATSIEQQHVHDAGVALSKPMDLNDMPPEVRAMIWECTLPPQRIFHVCSAVSFHPKDKPSTVRRFAFHIQHEQPATLSVCRESRAAALRRGFFISKCPHIWFDPDVDMLYFDRNNRRFLQSKEGEPLYTFDGLDRVQHLGVEWRAWFRDIPALQSERSMLLRWKGAFDSLQVYMPRLKTVNFILPLLRYCGGMGFGREPYGAWSHPCELVPLPERVNIPWGKTMPAGTNWAGFFMGSVSFGRELSTRMLDWESIQKQMEVAWKMVDGGVRDRKDEVGRGKSRRRRASPKIVGWWLIRTGDTALYNHPEVRVFTE